MFTQEHQLFTDVNQFIAKANGWHVGIPLWRATRPLF
jgi:hypothetical protein